MELYRKVRLACRDGMSERAAARHFGVSRQSVRKMLQFSVPPGYVVPSTFRGQLAPETLLDPATERAARVRSPHPRQRRSTSTASARPRRERRRVAHPPLPRSDGEQTGNITRRDLRSEREEDTDCICRRNRTGQSQRRRTVYGPAARAGYRREPWLASTTQRAATAARRPHRTNRMCRPCTPRRAPIKMRQFIFTHTSGPVPRHAVLGVGGVQ